ncbi:MAG TPA: molybdate ABC transporter substrate-binding protein [Steroidobacteraceae bacterium]|nr:molybdate ABC transporter substrate-binding protein [Steroidobacteraceae bacterium]
MLRRRYVVWAMAALLSLGAAGVRAADASGGVLVFAAASLANVLADLDKAFTARTGIRVTSSLAASSTLAKQIEAGAPADVYFSADLQWMDYLQQRGLLRPGSRHDVVGNSLVLIAPASSSLQVSIGPGLDLLRLLGGGRLAVADPDSVPAGIYAREALGKLGLWTGVAPRLVRAENVRTALAYVARGDAPLGIVYRTDALVETHVRVVGVFPANSHAPIVYPVALTGKASPAAARYLAFLTSAAARPTFRKWGFEPLPAGTER